MMKHTRKTLSRLAAMFLSVMLLAALAIVPASAVDGEGESVPPSEMTERISALLVTKTVTTDGNTYAPNTTFTIEVDEGEGGTFNDGENDVTALPGVEGGLSGTTLTSTPVVEDDEGNYVAPQATYTLNGVLTVNLEAFTGYTPGVYHYVVSETDGSYDGIEYDGSVYDVYLYLMRTEEDVPYIGYAVCVKRNSESNVKTDLTFTNDYDYDDPDHPDGTVHDVLVTKQIEGTFADMSDTFTFTVQVNAATGITGEWYKVVYTIDDVDREMAIQSGVPETINGIGDGDTIHIYGLSEGDTYTVTETDGTTKGYTVTDTVDGDGDGTVSGNVTIDNDTETITNTKNATAPTGIITTFAPYALMVVVAAAACFFFLRRRNAAED